jgi:hypothetical protein
MFYLNSFHIVTGCSGLNPGIWKKSFVIVLLVRLPAISKFRTNSVQKNDFIFHYFHS